MYFKLPSCHQLNTFICNSKPKYKINLKLSMFELNKFVYIFLII